MEPVTSWSCPTHILIGAGVARRYLEALDKPFIVADPAVGWRADVLREPSMSDSDLIAAVGDRPSGTTVVAIGGGSVLDPARLAVAGIDSFGEGVIAVPASPTASCDIVCIPSTIGTAAEVSPVAMVSGGRSMVISPALRARVAVLDPDVTVNADEAGMRSALIEPWARVVVPAVAESGLLLQDNLAFTMARVLEELAVAPMDEQWRQTAALASAQTHTAFVALQRNPFSHVVWPVAMEYAAAAGMSKQQALAVLLPRWLASRGRDDLADTVRSVWPGPEVAVDSEVVAQNVQSRWWRFDLPDPRDWLADGPWRS